MNDKEKIIKLIKEKIAKLVLAESEAFEKNDIPYWKYYQGSRRTLEDMIKKIEWLGIKHGYDCQVCGKPATKNCQENWCIYDITSEGEFLEQSATNTGDNEFYCQECYLKEYFF